MWSTIALVIIMLLLVVNMILLMDFSNTPQHNTMDKYNAVEGDMNIAHVIAELRGIIDDIELRLLTVESLSENSSEQLHKLEADYRYHIQSTDELKPKA